MELQTLDIPEDEARDKLAEYERQLASERTTEDAALRSAYRAASRGLAVISLPRTVAAGGFHDNGLPRIAVVRADVPEVYAWWDGSSVIYGDRDDWRINQGAIVNGRSVRVPLAGDDLPPALRRPNSWRAGSALVPLIPPGIRPRLSRIRGFHILWEVESWTRQPPRDPALVRHLRGDMWTVHAVWDLTELERSVLSQRVHS